MKLAQMKIDETRTQPHTRPNAPRPFTLAAARLRSFWRSAISKSSIWRSLARHAGGRRKTLSVRETAALGDRRFVSVIQFERQRFLIGSSPSSVTLLSLLPNESANGEPVGEKN